LASGPLFMTLPRSLTWEGLLPSTERQLSSTKVSVGPCPSVGRSSMISFV
jgi:hypothetical protein